MSEAMAQMAQLRHPKDRNKEFEATELQSKRVAATPDKGLFWSCCFTIPPEVSADRIGESSHCRPGGCIAP